MLLSANCYVFEILSFDPGFLLGDRMLSPPKYSEISKTYVPPPSCTLSIFSIEITFELRLAFLLFLLYLVTRDLLSTSLFSTDLYF